ncbi:uncharacterized protein LOC135385357 [Ornithodoros turicata]|uniref:uncharacterized protein LOC135385357 n=1 Tax=Ornithodoros turicata TaxID=34597 RepID=UPI00313956E5
MTRLSDLLGQQDSSVEEVEAALDYLVAKRQSLYDLDSSIAQETPEDQLGAELDSALQYEEGLEGMITRARRRLRQQHNVAPLDEQRPAGQKSVAPPKLQIPKFSGKLQEWQQFWQHFDATIHSNQALAPVEKFKYLVSYIIDDAKRSIESIRISGDNYDSAVTLRTHRYGRPELLTAEHIDHLLALRPISNSQNIPQLRRLHDDVTIRMAALDSLGVTKDKYAVILYRVITRCLPENLCVLFHQRRRDTAAVPQPQGNNESTGIDKAAEDLQALLSFLQVQVETREEVLLTRAVSPASAARSKSPNEPVRLPTAAALAAANAAPPKRTADARSTPCPLCHSPDHPLQSCTAVLPAADMRHRLSRAGRCFRCGKSGHFSRVCRSAAGLSCAKCHGHHLSILCDIQRRPEAQHCSTTLPATPDMGAPREALDDVVSQTVMSSSPSNVHAKSGMARLQTVSVWAEGPAGKKRIRLLLDTGSQQTFIRRDLLKELGCQISGEEDLSVFSFARTRHPRRFHCERVQVRLEAISDSRSFIELEALGISELCLVSTPALDDVTMSLLSLRGLEVADTSCTTDIALLVGSDYYWKLVTGRVELLPGDLVAVETIFGSVVQGVQRSPSRTLSTVVSVLSLCCEQQEFFDHMDPSEAWRLDALA